MDNLTSRITAASERLEHIHMKAKATGIISDAFLCKLKDGDTPTEETLENLRALTADHFDQEAAELKTIIDDLDRIRAELTSAAS